MYLEVDGRIASECSLAGNYAIVDEASRFHSSYKRGCQEKTFPLSFSPQKHHPTSGSNFFQPVFMVQPAENILDSDPASSG